MELRFIERDGKRILQQRTLRRSSGLVVPDAWCDVPTGHTVYRAQTPDKSTLGHAQPAGTTASSIRAAQARADAAMRDTDTHAECNTVQAMLLAERDTLRALLTDEEAKVGSLRKDLAEAKREVAQLQKQVAQHSDALRAAFLATRERG